MIVPLEHQKFLEMLLLDGCFVIEFIREMHEDFPEGEDQIINVFCICNQILRDLLLLENQLPFFVLSKLHNMTASQLGDGSFTEPAKFIWKLQVVLRAKLSHINSASFADFRTSNEEGNNIKHLLHALHMSYHRNSSMDNKGSDKDYITLIDENKILPTATELSEAGVHFEKAGSINYFRIPTFDKDDCHEESTTLLLDIKFKKGKMKIPCIRIVDDTESLLRNLIAYEQQSSDECFKYFSDFAVVMDSLINSEKDVSLLRNNGIIVSEMQDDKELANFFNRIGKGASTSLDDFYYIVECRKAFQHCKKPWNRVLANLRHNYCSSVWVGASTVAAIILLILTIMQTVLAFTGSVK